MVFTLRPQLTQSVDYYTQRNPNQPAPSPHNGLTTEQRWITNDSNLLLQDTTGRRTYDIPVMERHYHLYPLDNGHHAFRIKLLALEQYIITDTYLLDQITSQFYAFYADSCRCMLTTPRLLYPWLEGQLTVEIHKTV